MLKSASTPLHRNNGPSLNLIDGTSCQGLQDALTERHGTKVQVNFSRIVPCLDKVRENARWTVATSTTYLAALDPHLEPQKRLAEAMRNAGLNVEITPYRHAFISLPPGRTPADVNSKPISSFAPKIAYLAGRIATYTNAHFLVMSHSFELYDPLLFLAKKQPGVKVGIAYFRDYMDYRWKTAGLFDKDFAVRFFELDEFGKDLLGIDFFGRETSESINKSGLADL